MNEKVIERKLREWVESLGGLCLKFPATFFAGIPDRLCLLPNGVIFFAETKSTGLDLRPRQAWVKRKLETLGFKVHVVNSESALRALSLLYPAPLTKAEEKELDDLRYCRAFIKDRDPGDDLGPCDLERLNYLESKTP